MEKYGHSPKEFNDEQALSLDRVQDDWVTRLLAEATHQTDDWPLWRVKCTVSYTKTHII